MSELTERQLERFWSKIDKKGSDGCWLWTGGMAWCVPKFSVNRKGRSAPRLMWELKHNVHVDRIANVLRRCENERCVNPEHLVLAVKGHRMGNVRASRAARPVRHDVFELAWMVGYDLVRAPSGRLRVVKL